MELAHPLHLMRLKLFWMDYDNFITSFTSHLDPYSVEEIEALLLVEEEHFEKHRKYEQHIFQANVAFEP